MLRRLPAGNRVVGHRGRDDPGRVLGRGAPAGARGPVDLGALDGSADRAVAEPSAARPVPGHLREHGARRPDGRPPAGEHVHDAAAVPELAVGAFLHVVGAQSDVVLVGEIQMGRGSGLGRLRHLGRLGAEALYLGGGESVEAHCELGVALGEHGLQDARHGALFLPGRRVAGGAAHRVRDAAPPRGARVGVDDVRRSRSRRSASDSSSDEHILDTWLALMRPMFTPCATRFTFLVDTPLVTISDTAAMTARSTRDNRSTRSSGK